jgi:DNA-binding response OmpR family regulator
VRLLLVEDNERLAGFVAQGLRSAGFMVDIVGETEDAHAALASTRFDVCILDLGLPDGDGTDVLKDLRDRRDQTPVLILTARDDLSDRVAGLNLGADDYVVKPFAIEELVARIKALLRRPGAKLGVVLRIGNLAFDTIGRSVEVGGEPLVLSRLELMLLEELLRRSGRVVSRSVLEEAVYGAEEDFSANSLEAIVSRLRKKLRSVGTELEIHTIRGVGYMATEGKAP